ncbi:helix-turn-helix domain-containing protein [Nocardia alni]|uniref:AraC-like ligand-binding domain-containing protein n=1 Tax=Nocardia alni TaxID=2815723 RepID=UPI001C24F550|nr:helix-turn-helix domain-containing protein [Nocardia alni]
MQTLVTTQGTEPERRFDHWVGEVARTMFVAVDARPGTSEVFHGRAVGANIDELQLCWVSADPMQVSKSGRHSGCAEDAYYKFGLQIDGTAVVEQDGQRCRIGPRDLVLCDTSRPYSFSYDAPFRTLLALVPRSLIPLGPDSLLPITARRIEAHQGLAGIVVSFLYSLTGTIDHVGATSTPRLKDSTLSLLTGLLAEQVTEHHPDWSCPAIMLRVRDHIERHLSEPDLGPDSVCAALGLSRRYLFKLFAAEGATVAGYIRAQRLRRCARDLADPAMGHQSVGLIAARWGVADVSHFARLFKSAYGRTPREFRREAMEVGPQLSSLSQTGCP